MFIKSVKISNFRGIQDKEFRFGEKPFVLLAAQNGVGKTTVIDAIEWCLTGSIGRLKTSYDLRSTNDSERKINVQGILKHKNAAPDALVWVEVCVKEGNVEHTVYRCQKKDELGCSGRGVKIKVDNKDCEEGDWLSKHINQNFYNYHFCDIQKSLGIQNEKRSSLSEMFKEFITDYSDEEKVANNLELFQKDATLMIDEEEKAQEEAKNQQKIIEEKLKQLENVPSFQEYPDTVMYEGEIVDLKGKNQEYLKEQQNAVYACGYAHVRKLLKECIEHNKNKEIYKQIDALIKNIQENKNNIQEAIKAGLDKENNCITEIDDKLKVYNDIILNRSSILETGLTLVEFKDDRFTEIYFEEHRNKIQNLNNEIKELEEDIQTISKGNIIIQTLTELIEKKQALLEYRSLKANEDMAVKCPICGSEQFGKIESDQMMKEASVFLESSSSSLNKKVEEKENKNQECNKIKDDLILQGKEVLETKIRKETERKDKLLNIQKSTKEFFALQERISCTLDDKEVPSWWAISDNVINKKHEIEEKLSSDEEISEKKKEIEEILDVLSFKREDTEEPQTLFARIKDKAEQASKIMFFTKELLVDKINALIYRIQNEEIASLNIQMKKLENEFEIRKNEINRIRQVKDWANIHEDKIRNLIKELIQQEYESVGPNLYKFYKKLSRINTIKNINIVPDGIENQVSLTDETGKHVVNILSNGQLSVFILAYFFAGIVSRGYNENFKIYFIDDLTSCMDDVNMLSFLDLLKYLLKEKEGIVDQLFFATCDEHIEKLLCYKMEGGGIPYIKLSEKDF